MGWKWISVLECPWVQSLTLPKNKAGKGRAEQGKPGRDRAGKTGGRGQMVEAVAGR